jgi:hypothetical protein
MNVETQRRRAGEDPHVVMKAGGGGGGGDMESGDLEAGGWLSVSVEDICTNIWRKATEESKEWDAYLSLAMRVVACGVAAMPFFWRAYQYGWENLCGRRWA